MFEGVVANLLNKYLGKYIQNLDSKNLQVSIYSGKVELTDLTLKPEALYELNLPIEVKAGHVGKIIVDLDWLNLFSKPAVITIQDVYALAGPVLDRQYDVTREQVLERARKKNLLEQLERNNAEPAVLSEDEKSQGFVDSLAATLINNIQITVQGIHIRYEDSVTRPGHPFACGVMLQKLDAHTTDASWKPVQVDGAAKTVHKLVKLSGLSLYWNPYLPDQSLVRHRTENMVWRNLLRNSIDAHTILEEEFEFILSPISSYAKVVMNKESELTLPRLLVDLFMDDIEVMVTRQQFLNMLCLQESFKLMAVNQRYRKHHPGVGVSGHVQEWWHYAANAVIEEKIRPWTWQYIKNHREKYRAYKDTYKKWLGDRSNATLQNELELLEDGLDVANITIARGQAKYEFAHETPPTPREKPPQKSGWFSWWFSDEEDEEEIITQPESEKFLDNLSPEEREELFEAVGYSENVMYVSNPEYVAHKVNLYLRCCSLSLRNYSKEVLKIIVKHCDSTLEHRPTPTGLKLTTTTESFSIEGISLEHDLVPLITSDVGVYPSSQRQQVFHAEFELNPVHVQTDFAVAMNVQPVEMVYDEHAVTEILAFLQVPHLTPDEMSRMMADSLVQLQQWSRAGLQHAINTHKTLHVSVNMRSPYVVIPEYGTLHRGGNVLVLDFGKLKIESRPQQAEASLEQLTLSEVEERLYDRYSVTITEVKALLADSGEDWHTAQTQQDSEFHILPSVAVQLGFFNSVKPDYTDLPRFQVHGKLLTNPINLLVSETRITKIALFYARTPLPSTKTRLAPSKDKPRPPSEGFDEVDNIVLPAGMAARYEGAHRDSLGEVGALPLYVLDKRKRDVTDLQQEPTMAELRKMKRSCYRNSVSGSDRKLNTRTSVMSQGSEVFYSASDHSDEDIDEWALGLDAANLDELSSKTNKVKAFARFLLGDVLIQICKSADKVDTPYLMLRINRMSADASFTDFGMAVHARLGGIQLVDKIHQGPEGEYLEVLSSRADKDLILLTYRKVDPECPEFATIYQSIEQGMSVKMSSVKVVFHRAAILYLNTFVQSLMQNVSSSLGTSQLRGSASTILSSEPQAGKSHAAIDPPTFIQRLSSQVDPTASTNNNIKMHMYAKIEDITIKLCDHEMDFSKLNISGLEGKISVKAARTLLHTRLSDLSVEDLTESTLHPKVLSIDDDNAFDFKLTKYNTECMKSRDSGSCVDGSAKLRIGKVHVVFLNKFVAEMTGFMEPFMNPEVTQQYKVAAQNAAYHTIADAQEQGTKYSFCIDVKSPTVHVPQNSGSTNVIVLKLGDLNVKNYFEDTEIGGGVLQKWDHIYLNLESVSVIRGKLSMTGATQPEHTIIEPINLKLDLKRALPPHRLDIYYDLQGRLHKVNVNLMPTDLKVMMAVMRDNLSESGHMPPVAIPEPTERTSPFSKHESLDTTTPIVEIEEPLLSAPEVSELVKDAKANFDFDGVEINLETEEEEGQENEAQTPGSRQFAQFDISSLRMSGTFHQDKTMEIELSLKSMDLVDVREHSALAIKRILQTSVRPRGSYDESPPVIRIWYRKKEDNNTHLEFEIETIRVNACVPYLLEIQHFFMDALISPELTHNLPASISAYTMPASRTRESLHHANTQYEEQAEPMSLTVTGQFKQPEIVLFAEPTSTRSRALVLKASGNFNYYYVNGKEDIDAKLKQVKIISGVWGDAKKTASMVMHPCNIELTRQRENSTAPIIMNLKISDMHVNVSSNTILMFMEVCRELQELYVYKEKHRISDMYVNVSSTTLHMFMEVYRVVQEDQVRGSNPEDASGPPKRYYDLWNVKSISREEWLQTEEDKVPIQLPDDTVVAKETLNLDLPRLQVMFEVENLDYNMPHMCLKCDVQAEAHDWSTQLRARADLSVEILYFNDKLSVWEPLVEPVMVTEDNYRPWQLSLRMAQAESHPISCTPPTPGRHGAEELDSAVTYWLQNMSRQRTSSSESAESAVGDDEVDEGGDRPTEMTVIRTQNYVKSAGAGGGRARTASAQSYDNLLYDESESSDTDYEAENIGFDDSTGHHNSLQGESDSEDDLRDTLSSGLESMLSSTDSSDGRTDGEEDDDLFDTPQKPVFMTSKGPVHLNSEVGEDVLDGLVAEEAALALDGGVAMETGVKPRDLCNYILLDSLDQLLLNVTPHALDVLTEVAEAFTNKELSVLKSVQDLPAFEVFNNLGVEAELTFDKKNQTVYVDEHWKEPEETLLENFEFARTYRRQSSVYRPRLHRLRLSAHSVPLEEAAEPVLVEIEDDDELDGLHHINKALAGSANVAMAAGAPEITSLRSNNSSSSNKDETSQVLDIKLDGFQELAHVSHCRDVTQLIPLQQDASRDDTMSYALVYDVSVTHGRKVVTLRSPLQVFNHLNMAVELFCLKSDLKEYNISDKMSNSKFTSIIVVKPHAVFDVPLYVAYHCKLYMKPQQVGVCQTEQGVWWQEFIAIKDKRRQFMCEPENNNDRQFRFKVVCEEGKASRRLWQGKSLAKSTPHFTLHLHPPVVLHNLLPYDISFSLQTLDSVELAKGEKKDLHSVDLTQSAKLTLKISDYLNTDWTGQLDLDDDLEEFKAITMENEGEGEAQHLSLSVHSKSLDVLDMYVYSPYWIINKTGQPVQLRGSRSEATYENGDKEDPLLFRFKKYKRKKAKLRVYSSKWTRSFSLDTVASNGVVICTDKERQRKYHFMLQIEMSNLRLTKMVTILPYFLVVNKTDQSLRFMEENHAADLWNDIQPEECVPFWPVAESYKVCVQFPDSTNKSQHFSITSVQSVVLRMDKGSALCVDITGGAETSFTVTFRPYEAGDAPVRIDNLCDDVFLKLFQKNHSHALFLAPCQSMLYTWDDPTLERTLMWNSAYRKQTSQPAHINKDGSGSVYLSIQSIKKTSPTSESDDSGIISTLLRRSRSKELNNRPPPESSTDDDSDNETVRTAGKSRTLLKGTRTDKVQVHWVSYLDAGQRVLQFSQDERIAKKAAKRNEAEPANMEVFMSLRGIGLSLINALYEEVAFITLTSSPAMWEVENKKKTRMLGADLASLLEECWRKGETNVQRQDLILADFSTMEMKRPFLGSLRRLYNPALWVHYRQSLHHMYVHTKIHRLQIDNQLRDAYFPSVLYPSPAPSFIVKKAGPKPFIECMLLRKTIPESHIDAVKFASALIQEFNIRLDKGFMLSVYDIFAARQDTVEESEQLQADVASTKRTLQELSAVHATSRPQRIFFEYLHLSPLKMHVSFSLYGNVHKASPGEDQSIASDVIEFFLTSIGATLSEIKDVELRMAYLQREGVMLTWSQLQSEVTSHYVSQALKQAYVLLLGLDVLGNPYGLIKDFTKGLGDFFYEPFMGSIAQPDQFAERLSYGMHSLLGHTVGSVAGSVSLVTGSVGRTLAMLSFDDEYQIRRRRYVHQQPKHLPESIYLAGKSFVMGVALGISGVVSSPRRGAKEEGVEGFFKGIGKGLLGLLTKPTGGAVDMVSMAFDGIRRTAEMGEDVVMRIRIPRYIHPLVGVRPFSYYQAVGMRILYNVDKGELVETDRYWAHAALSTEERADVLLISDRRILLLEKCRFWGDWDVDWSVELDKMLGIPAVTDDKLIVSVKQDEDEYTFLSSDKHVAQNKTGDAELLLWLQRKIEEAVIFAHEHY